MSLSSPPNTSSVSLPTAPSALPLPAGALDDGYEQLLVCNDPEVGLLAIVCIDSTVLGPSDGGVRMFPYATFADAIHDVTRLARAMTLKWAAAGEDRGGGKAVIVGDPRHDKSEARLRRFGQFVDSLGGQYWAGADAGTTLRDMEVVHTETRYVATLPVLAGGVGEIGPATAAGALHAMRACADRVWRERSLRGRRVALQGLGSCGRRALEQLVAEGAQVVVADVDGSAVHRARAQFGVEAVEPDEIYDVACDVFAPFALGGVLTHDTLARLDARVVAGSANNVMAADDVEAAVVARGITYAVDFVANAGGAIKDADRFRPGGHDPDRVAAKLAAIGPRIESVLDRAAATGVLPSAAARALAAERLAAMAPLRARRARCAPTV
jgi:leucine dehydrogenase